MYLDDMGRYTHALNDTHNQAVMERTFLTGQYMFYAGELLERGVVHVRLLTSSMMIIASMVFYFLLRNFLKVPPHSALVAALLPNIISGIDMLPSFLSGSYTIPGQIVAVTSAILTICFITQLRFGYAALALASVLYYCSFEFMDQALFLLLPFILLFFYASGFRFTKRLLIALGLFFAIATYDLTIYILSDKPSFVAPANIELLDMFSRFVKSLRYSFPIPKEFGASSIIMLTTFSVFSIIGLWVWIKDLLTKATLRERVNFSFPLAFGLSIFVSVGFTFWTITPYFSNRYFHLPAFGAALIVAFLMFQSLKLLPKKIRSIFAIILASTFIVSTGHSKYTWLEKKHQAENYYHTLIEEALEPFNFPEAAQLVITGNTSIGTGGYHHYSSGYLKFLTRRADITGIFSRPEMQFYDPFRPEERGYVTYMTGVDLDQPVFLFRMDTKTKKIDQMQYALQWKDASWTEGIPGQTKLNSSQPEVLQSSPWTIYKFDLVSGSNIEMSSGIGISSLEAYMKQNASIGDQSNLLFGGKMTEQTRERFGLDPQK